MYPALSISPEKRSSKVITVNATAVKGEAGGANIDTDKRAGANVLSSAVTAS
jgi:hypothetical protein